MTKADTIKNIRSKHYKETKGLSAAEKADYNKKKADSGGKRLAAKAVRAEQVLIRLTALERLRLERDARKENTNVSALIRQRALCVPSPIDSILDRLGSIESMLKK
jgi:hypothetical protein